MEHREPQSGCGIDGSSVLCGWLAAWLLVMATAQVARGANELAEARKLLRSGAYPECAKLAAAGIEKSSFTEEWRMLKIRSEMARGNYADALKDTEAAVSRFPNSIRLRWLARRVMLFNNKPDAARNSLLAIEQLARQTPWRYTDPENQIILGRYFLQRGVDAKQVLDVFYSAVKKDRPEFPGIYTAIGELALSKHDAELAAEHYERALKLEADNADAHWGLAQAHAESDAERANAALQAALKVNPNHVDSLLMLIDTQVDSENYQAAREVLRRLLKVNSHEPRAWAYHAVLAHLENSPGQEAASHKVALTPWSTNPEVDHLIGRKLSQKYRFSEGAEYQRRALKLDPKYLPAKVQLCQDLLRLGDEQRGWELAAEVYEADGYNVLAHNLVNLKERLEQFRTLESDGFLVRMEAREAEIYGARVVALLQRARRVLCEKYDLQIEQPVVVEIFPRQEDFAIRTFGMPGGAGFLGVCFGRVITANSPASQGEHPTNWQSVLWHEFCHVVTLQKTRNKMPRWLSEGISVYEERQQDATWGQSLTPRYRAMILGGELTPVSRLSAAFLSPQSPLHLQFAYFESSLVVEYLIATYGIDAVRKLLDDLASGLEINDALQRHAGGLQQLDAEFAAFARKRAEGLAPGIDWETKPELRAEATAEDWAEWNQKHPDTYAGLNGWAQKLIVEQEWAAAKVPLKRLVVLYPQDASPGNALQLLGQVHRRLQETAEERQVLLQLVALDGNAFTSHLRLAELAVAARQWEQAEKFAEMALAVNPLLAPPHRFLVAAAEKLEHDQRAIAGNRALLRLQPVDPGELHFRLARLLNKTGDRAGAKRAVLQCLENAPRYRAALHLLLELNAMETGDKRRPEVQQKPDASSQERS